MTQSEHSRAILMFYKQKHDWGSPLAARLQGDVAVGEGVNRFFISQAMSSLQNGFNIDFGCGTGDTTLLFEGQGNHLAIKFDLKVLFPAPPLYPLNAESVQVLRHNMMKNPSLENDSEAECYYSI
ncbi:hypothetical protein EOD39_20317 [Acipenser ruthenus]|uniref:Uncharacterized protein n=1 Tax=Acipenser ruthenus TaxID=7906 RepID=A0A444UVS8_ACIRT|nr:hypothetical protein EOD39_20317 [Acipenser ruthenus]